METKYQLVCENLKEKEMLIKTRKQEFINLFPQIKESVLFIKEFRPDLLCGELLQELFITFQNLPSKLDSLKDIKVQLDIFLNNSTGTSSFYDDIQEIDAILNRLDDFLEDLEKDKEKLEFFLNIISNIKSAKRASELPYNTE